MDFCSIWPRSWKVEGPFYIVKHGIFEAFSYVGQVANKMPYDRFFDRFWGQPGLQNRAKINQKSIKKVIKKVIDFLIDF